jgi:hypothetical protein
LWWISPTYQLTTENIVEPQLLYTVRAWIQAPVLLFGIAGGVLALKRNRRLLVQCLWWIAVFTLPFAVSIAGNTRYRLPAESMVLMLIAFFLSVVTRRLVASISRVQSLEVRMHGAG